MLESAYPIHRISIEEIAKRGRFGPASDSRHLKTSGEQPDRILIRGVNWLGDAIMTTPALMAIRELYPDSQITLLTRDSLADLWIGHPAVDRVLTFSTEDHLFQLGKRLRGERFDLGIIFPNSIRAAMEMVLARIPIRVGYKSRGRSWLLTHHIPRRRNVFNMKVLSERRVSQAIKNPPPPPVIAPESHHVSHYLHLVAQLGASEKPTAPSLAVSESELAVTAERFGIPMKLDRPIIGINPGAQYGPAKRWPVEKFIRAAGQIHSEHDCHFIVFGGHDDFALTDQVANALILAERNTPNSKPLSLFNVSGKTSLRELAALLKHCSVLISNDTGPTHLAAAVGTPVVVPFGSTSPELTGPGCPGENHHSFLQSTAACAPCFRRDCPIDFRCMDEITVEAVAAAAGSKLEKVGPAGS
jgi:heptosyltransferase-2